MPGRLALPGVVTVSKYLLPFRDTGMSRFFALLLCLLFCLCLGACNFSSDSNSSSRALGSSASSSSSGGARSASSSSGAGAGSGAEMSGTFLELEGIGYRTPSFSGVTDSDGTFRYRDGEQVEFFLGGIILGEAAGADELTPFDLAGSAPYTEEADLRAALENHQWPDALDIVSNIMLLLLTLDRDQNPDNGIDLSGWNADLADYRVDFFYDLYAFPYRRGLDSLPAIKTAFSIKYQLPLDAPLVYLYDVLGIVVPVHLPVRETRNIQDDEQIEQEVRWEYNSLGLPRIVDFTVLPDTAETWRERLSYDYDSLGRRIFMLRETDTDENGTVDFFYRNERFYSDNGFLVRVVEEDGELLVGERRVYRFEYDDGGNNVLSVYELDDNVDEILDSLFRVESLYDEDGLLEWRLEELDLNADGIVERRQRFEFLYNRNGLLLELVDTLDDGDLASADGVVDVRSEVEFRYGSGERLFREIQRIDDNGDGVVDRENTYEYVYLTNGKLREQTWEFDVDADGTVESRRTFTYRYTNDNNLFSEEMTLDNDADGTPEAREQIEYRYNSRGQLREVEIATYNGSDDLQSRLFFERTYGVDGQLTSWFREGEGRTGTTNTPVRIRWQYLPFDDGLRYLIDHYRYRHPAYTEIGITDLTQPCENYRFAEAGTVCALSWPMRWRLLWGEVWKAPGVNLGGPVVVRP
ncbi:hypothetical protein [Microbulbifer elongatus]|uniref:hypothetical protein n=1 Tax=Microbulbifer elongatus TaxID=86173 RepID=UPI001CFC79B0|nr:hypothetical protein [Microbulbifer elongatus]